MQRWTALVFLAVVAAAVGALILGRRTGEAGETTPAASAASTVIALALPPRQPPPTRTRADEIPPEPVEAPEPTEGPDAVPQPSSTPLSASAPRTVTFGVVLVTYRGAQGAASDARSRDEARALAEKVAATASRDFAEAVKLGDLGFADAGEMPRDVLEPAAEAALFELRAGEVSAPVDSPRGYYVFRRIE